MELRELSIPYMSCASPHRLQGLATRVSDADHAVWKLANVLSIADDSFGDYVPTKDVSSGIMIRPERGCEQ
jgi:hypothetical protein